MAISTFFRAHLIVANVVPRIVQGGSLGAASEPAP